MSAPDLFQASTVVDTSRDLPDIVHGIVSLDPPVIRCDGCGHEHSERTLALTVLLADIRFNPLAFSLGDRRRMCRPCRAAAGWVER